MMRSTLLQFYCERGAFDGETFREHPDWYLKDRSSGEYDEVKSEVKLSREQTMKLMRKNFEYKLAIALVMASNYFYFGYAEGHIADGRPVALFAPDYPEFGRPLGPPLGPALKAGSYQYERKFRHAAVQLDIAARRGNITWQ